MKIQKLEGDWMCKLPEPGIYNGVPDEVYHSWPGASASRLKTLKQTPAHLKYSLDNPTIPTDAMMLGTALHSITLEPGEAWKDQVPGKTEKTRTKNLDLVERMHQSLLNHPQVKQFLSSLDETELSLVWVDEESGITCKARLDGWIESSGTVMDLKTTICAAHYKFFSQGAKLGYHIQAAMYLSGAKALGMPAKDFVFIPIEKAPPFLPNLYPVASSAIQSGEYEMQELLKKYQYCVQKDYWPGYEIGEEFELPDWYKMGGPHE